MPHPLQEKDHAPPSRRTLLCTLAGLALSGHVLAQNLAPGTVQKEQGSFQANAGEGMVTYTAKSTTYPKNLAGHVEQHMVGKDATLKAADARAGARQGTVQSSVMQIAQKHAGKTQYDAKVSELKFHGGNTLLTLNVNARGSDGTRIDLSVSADPNTLAQQDSQIDYFPQRGQLFDRFSAHSKKGTPQVVKLEKLERVGDT